MSDVQRWDMNHVQGEVYIDKKPEGSWVTYADHLAAVAAARTMGYVEGQADMRKYLLADDTHSFTYGYREGVRDARDAVAALPAYYAIEECQGNPLEKGDPEDPDPWKQGHLIERDDALAAIDGVEKP